MRTQYVALGHRPLLTGRGRWDQDTKRVCPPITHQIEHTHTPFGTGEDDKTPNGSSDTGAGDDTGDPAAAVRMVIHIINIHLDKKRLEWWIAK